MNKKMMKLPAEKAYEKELLALKKYDKGPKPANWLLSPKAVRTFILGSDESLLLDGEEIMINKKFYGDDSLIERCIVTLAGNRGLMLVGEPGTAKTMLSELLTAAICGTSTNTIQGTAGTTEDMMKYSWNYAMLLANGPSRKALVPSPLYIGMEKGIITRLEEITRCPSEVQDSLISLLSDKVLNIPELGKEGVLFAYPGFNVIATANIRDKGVNEMSSALKRRFNFETVFPIKDLSLEIEIIEKESKKLLEASGIDMDVDQEVATILASTFHELREGITVEGHRLDKPEAIMSTAEAVSVYFQSAMSAYYYDDGKMSMDRTVQNILGAVIKENREDLNKLKNYFTLVVKSRSVKEGSLWKDYYAAKKWIK
ncbi:ATP-binding protein [Crassaminicella profunda]|uniref:ATP-binding protein n=1 Tax=Crassaminicella profunda TaxID=1286698 RepID=UPI001CA749C7|nr:AAA family ATPase [Crassaminicella profunda]QZY56177.1 AAA family ATPase [Crassaminicella profunda]